MLKKGDATNERTIVNPASTISASVNDVTGAFSASSTFAATLTPNQAGPFGLVVYIKAEIIQISPFTGTITPGGVVDATGQQYLAVTVYRTTTGTVGQSNGQNPATDQQLANGAYCRVVLNLHLAGTFDTGTGVLNVHQDPFTIPVFPLDTRVNGAPVAAQGCTNNAGPSINAQLAGPSNSIDLTYGGTATGVNHAPVANAGTDQATLVNAGVTLDGSGSTDADSDPLTYAWTQTGGTPVTLSDATAQKPTFTAPAAASNLTFSLVVSDGRFNGTSTADQVSVDVTLPVNHPPTANAGPDQSVGTTAPVTLDGSGSTDPDSDPLTYAWTQTGGTTVTLSDATAQKPTFTSPAADTTLTFDLTVDDGRGGSHTDSVTIGVAAVPTTGSISGQATSGGSPATGVNVRLWLVGASAPAATTTTDAGGAYSFPKVSPGSYQVQFAQSGGYLTAWYTDAPLRLGAQTLVVHVLDGLVANQELVKGQHITGTVRDSGTNNSLTGVRVFAFRANGEYTGINTVTGEGGHYDLGLLPYGNYQVLAVAVEYLNQWSGSSPDQANATIIPLSGGAPPVVDFSLIVDPPGTTSVSGTLTSSTTGLPIAGANVRLWKAFTNSYVTVTTDSKGHYTMAGLPVGTYQLQFAKAGSYQTRWYNGALVRGTAGNLVLASNADLVIDATLPPNVVPT